MKLVIVSVVGQGKEFEIHEGNNLVGRWDPEGASFPEIDLEQEDVDAKVSRKHCILERNGQDLFVQDIGSLNGTFVEQGKRLEENERHQLQEGDEVVIGKIVLKVSLK